jgi:hypothetical protein
VLCIYFRSVLEELMKVNNKMFHTHTHTHTHTHDLQLELPHLNNTHLLSKSIHDPHKVVQNCGFIYILTKFSINLSGQKWIQYLVSSSTLPFNVLLYCLHKNT